MATTFNKTIKEMGYVIDKQDEEIILLKKTDKIFNVLVLFNQTNKQLLGALQPTKLIYSQADALKANILFDALQEDLKTFKQLSNYDIMN